MFIDSCPPDPLGGRNRDKRLTYGHTSTHTGGILGYTYRDLTEDMRPFMKHWKELDIRFDAVYSGFLGSFEQLDIVKEFFSLFKRKDNLILVDPVMGDNGELYKIFTPKFAKGMRSLCEKRTLSYRT